jgi:Na+-translocating ferredoxin:NAD+ oxidoreductase RnfA subunit
MNATRPGTPTWATRTLGVLGIAGGFGLLLAYLLEIPPAWNALRLVLFCAGAIAIALATHGRHAAVSRRLALAGTIPLVIANALYIGWILLSLGQERPFAGDFGLVGFWAALAFWLADAWFGLVALQLGAVWRGAAAILVAGSLMAIAGMDRLGLTSPADPTIFGPIALAGVALNGLAWILLGVPVAFPRIGRLCGRSPVTDGSPAPADGPA